MSTIKLTGSEAARVLRSARADRMAPSFFDMKMCGWRPLTRGEIARGERYLRREDARRAENVRQLANVNAMHAVAAASGLAPY